MRKRVKRVRQHSKTLADPCLIVDSREKKEPTTNSWGGFIGFFFRESDSRVKSKSASEKWTNTRAAEWPISALQGKIYVIIYIVPLMGRMHRQMVRFCYLWKKLG